MFPDNDPKNPRLGNYTAEGEWVIPKSKSTKFNEAYAANVTAAASNATAPANATLM